MEECYYNGALGFYFDINLSEYVFEAALSQWTERSQLGNGYNKREVQFYDALIWTRVINAKQQYQYITATIRERTKSEKNRADTDAKNTFPSIRSSAELQDDLNNLMKSINTWKYTGQVYRVIDCGPAKIDYHEMIASWTSSLYSFSNFNHLSRGRKYTFLTGTTGRDWGFDVNRYRDYIGNGHVFTEDENEIILPMNKKYVKDIFYGTLNEFYKHINIKEQIKCQKE